MVKYFSFDADDEFKNVVIQVRVIWLGHGAMITAAAEISLSRVTIYEARSRPLRPTRAQGQSFAHSSRGHAPQRVVEPACMHQRNDSALSGMMMAKPD